MALPYIRKINRGFKSVFENLTSREMMAAIGYGRRFPNFFRKIFHRLYLPHQKFEFMTGRSRPHDGELHVGHRFLGTLQPFVDMAKDVANTFKPYKTIWPHAIKDFLQPLRGIGNILKALATVVAFPLFLTIGTIDAFFPFKADQPNNGQRRFPLSRRIKMNFAFTFSLIPHALTTFIRGVSQIAFTPLAWLKVIVRSAITAKKGRLKLEDDRGVRQLIRESEIEENKIKTKTIGEHKKSIDDALRQKWEKAAYQGREVPQVPLFEHNDAVNETNDLGEPNDAQSTLKDIQYPYIKFFSAEIKKQDETVPLLKSVNTPSQSSM